MAHWLLKTEPETYSYDDLVRDGQTAWDGVRNFLARNHLQAMKPGDLGFLYHSVGPREIVGMVEVVSTPYPDATSDDPRWVCVDVKPVGRLPRNLGLDEIKRHPSLQRMEFVRMSRLSVSPVTPEEWREVLRVTELGTRPVHDVDQGATQGTVSRKSPEPGQRKGQGKASSAFVGSSVAAKSTQAPSPTRKAARTPSKAKKQAARTGKAGAVTAGRGRNRAT
ncbi:MAG: EVE domain-containing protein [Myxococcota bacterium]